jgi:hypothetical protein
MLAAPATKVLALAQASNWTSLASNISLSNSVIINNTNIIIIFIINRPSYTNVLCPTHLDRRYSSHQSVSYMDIDSVVVAQRMREIYFVFHFGIYNIYWRRRMDTVSKIPLFSSHILFYTIYLNIPYEIYTHLYI